MRKHDILVGEPTLNSQELKQSRLAPAIELMYRILGCPRHRKVAFLLLHLTSRLEGGEYFSATIRKLAGRYHDIDVGAYSYGACFQVHIFSRGVTVGRFCSLSKGCRVYVQNHPLDRLSTHPFFYEKGKSIVSGDMKKKRLIIEHDVWIGDGAIVTPGCKRIGLGAVIGAGAVVTKDVPEFAIMGGNPARLIRHRFEPEVADRIRQSRWWEKSWDELSMTVGDVKAVDAESRDAILRNLANIEAKIE